MGGPVYLGVMSGTSLDGLDLAACTFQKNNFQIVAATTIAYPDALISQLKKAPEMQAGELRHLDVTLGKFIGEKAKAFLEEHHLYEDTIAIASHGHTVIHQPLKGYTLQIGEGASMAAQSGLKVINDFRSNDVAHGGQGAPLVPIGDLELFRGYTFCLNLGGIANLSCKTGHNAIVGFDICGCNLLLNKIARQLGIPYDEHGQHAASGAANEQLLTELFSYHISPLASYSLDAQEAIQAFFKIADIYELNLKDQLATAVSFIAQLTGASVQSCLEKQGLRAEKSKLLVTGGGAHNDFLIHQLRNEVPVEVVVPAKAITDFKEALVFAYMGKLRLEEKVNCLATVTGATKDTVGGVCHLP